MLGKQAKVLGRISLCFMDMEPKTEFPSRLSTFFDQKNFFQKRFLNLATNRGKPPVDNFPIGFDQSSSINYHHHSRSLTGALQEKGETL